MRKWETPIEFMRSIPVVGHIISLPFFLVAVIPLTAGFESWWIKVLVGIACALGILIAAYLGSGLLGHHHHPSTKRKKTR